jgi:putative ABC transport system substrate-binding protein
MDRRSACVAVAALASLAAIPATVRGARNARVAWTSVDRADPRSPYLLSFRENLRTAGWTEGENLTLDVWWGDGSTKGLKDLVPQIVARRPEVIVTAGGAATRTLVDAKVPQPIAFTVSADVVLAKLVNSWARPGVNRSGVSFFALEIIPKRLELMTEVLPEMKRVGIVGWPPHAGELLELEAARNAAGMLGLEHRYFGANTATEVDQALEAAREWGAQAILAFAGGIAPRYADRFAAFAGRHRIPAFSSWAAFAEKGNLMTYGPVLEECYARLATLVDRILKGAKPAELPVERPTKFELVVNLSAAKTLGISFPQSILLRADRVIE